MVKCHSYRLESETGWAVKSGDAEGDVEESSWASLINRRAAIVVDAASLYTASRWLLVVPFDVRF